MTGTMEAVVRNGKVVIMQKELQQWECGWILRYDLSEPTWTVYCRKPKKYTMVWDNNEPESFKVRKYSPFCEEHMDRYYEDQHINEED